MTPIPHPEHPRIKHICDRMEFAAREARRTGRRAGEIRSHLEVTEELRWRLR